MIRRTISCVVFRLLAAVGLLLTIGPSGAAGAEPPSFPPLEKLLAQAIENHPKIVAAKAKVALAEAQLREIQFQVAQEIIDLDAERTGLATSLQLAKTTLQAAEAQYKTGRGLQAELVTAQKGVIDLQTRLAKVELQLRQIAGSVGNAAARPAGAMASPEALDDYPAPQEEPQDTQAAVQLLGCPISLNILDLPLSEVTKQICDLIVSAGHVPKPRILVDEGIGDLVIDRLEMSDCAHLIEAIQALEDRYPKIKFVVREYGLFVTTPQKVRAGRFVPAVGFWREHSGEYQPIANRTKPDGGGVDAKPTTPSRPASKPATKAAPAAKPVEKPATTPSKVGG